MFWTVVGSPHGPPVVPTTGARPCKVSLAPHVLLAFRATVNLHDPDASRVRECIVGVGHCIRNCWCDPEDVNLALRGGAQEVHWLPEWKCRGDTETSRPKTSRFAIISYNVTFCYVTSYTWQERARPRTCALIHKFCSLYFPQATHRPSLSHQDRSGSHPFRPLRHCLPCFLVFFVSPAPTIKSLDKNRNKPLIWTYRLNYSKTNGGI